MIRNLKVLGLALTACLALGAVAASAASAQGMITSDGPVTLVGQHDEAEGAGPNALTSFGSETVCPNATYTGHKVEETPHALIPSGATETTITPHYGNCTTSGFNSTVTMNGCDYEFDLEGTDESAANTYDVLATIVCPQGKHIVVDIWIFTSKAHAPNCEVTITNDPNGYSGLHATDLGNNKFRIEGTVTGVEAHKSGPSGFCPTETEEAGELHQDIIVEGLNSKGKTTEMSLSH